MTDHDRVPDRVVALTRDECIALVAGAPYGRIVYTADALPAVLPVTFVLEGGVLFFDVAAGSALADASRDGVLAFHADWIDVEGGRGWSVTMTGRARHVGPTTLNAGGEDGSLGADVAGGRSSGSIVTVALDPELVSGHRAVIAVPPRSQQDPAPS